MDHDACRLLVQRVRPVIFASVPVLQPPDQMEDTWPTWRGAGAELLIVDNTADRAWEPLALDEGWSWIGFGKNLGVCASWNLARAWFLAPDPHYYECLLLFSSSLSFDDALPATMKQMNLAASWKGVQSQHGPHAIAWSSKVLRTAGTWDENYFPGYSGDTDYFRRLIIEGILVPGPDEMPQVNIAAPEPEDGRAIKRTGLITNQVCCSAYYEAKWGGPPGAEKFDTPFDSGLPTSWWSPAYRPGLELVDLTTSRYR